MTCCNSTAPATTTQVMKGSVPRKGMLDTHRGDNFGYFTPTFFLPQASFELISTNFHCCPLPSNPSERSSTPTCPNSTSLGCEGDVSIRESGERVCYSMLVSLGFIFLFPFQPHPYRATCSRTFSFLSPLLVMVAFLCTFSTSWTLSFWHEEWFPAKWLCYLLMKFDMARQLKC